MTPERWPALPYDDWKDTYAPLHMWSQIVGKIALARIAPINHSWGIALDVTARGLTTRTLRCIAWWLPNTSRPEASPA